LTASDQSSNPLGRAAYRGDPATFDGFETEAISSSVEERINQYGFGFWAAELKGTKGFIGFIGLSVRVCRTVMA
jgi:hypothetical protein